VASSFETARSLSSGAHSRDPLAPPLDEVLNPHGEERGNAARLRTMLRIALRTMRPLKRKPAYFSPTLNGGSLPGGTVSSAIASNIATIT
jgi:hypothetical protein